MGEALPVQIKNPLQLVQKPVLTPKQLLVARLIAELKTNREICAEAKINLSTLQRWKKLPQVEQQVKTYVDDTYKSSQQRLRGLMNVALNALQRAAESPVNSVATRAAEIILRSQPQNVPESVGKLVVKFGGLRRAVETKPQ
jgi:hypothetical protein